MRLREQVVLAPYTTMRVGGPARWFAEAASEADVLAAVGEASRLNARLFVLGGGSNLLVPDEGFDGLVLHVALLGIDEPEAGLFDVAAGEAWDGLVRVATSRNYAGIECVAGIPGTVGGTPVQNVGAYGQEVAETIVSVRAYDREQREFVEMTAAECGFRYRQSVFNTTARGRYIVSRVRFRLHPGGAPTLAYADLQRCFGVEAKPSLDAVADAVREIRARKGMVIVEGDADCRSAGSFFKNPIVLEATAAKVAEASGVPEVPQWPAGNGLVKLPAAWLLERAGFERGFALGRAAVSGKHTLALTNRGGATYAEIDALAGLIEATVRERFGIVLEREPVVLG